MILAAVKVDRLIDLLHFEVMRMRYAIGTDDAVHAEVAVIRNVAEISSIDEAARWIRPVSVQRLVDPIPDEAAAQHRFRVDQVPVVREVADAVAHGMGVLVHQERAPRRIRSVLLFGRGLASLALSFGLSLEVLFEPGDVGIGLAVDVSGKVHVGILNQPLFGICRPAGVSHRQKRRAVAGFVPERPHDDARMLAVPHHHPLHAFHDRRRPIGLISGQNSFVITQVRETRRSPRPSPTCPVRRRANTSAGHWDSEPCERS